MTFEAIKELLVQSCTETDKSCSEWQEWREIWEMHIRGYDPSWLRVRLLPQLCCLLRDGLQGCWICQGYVWLLELFPFNDTTIGGSKPPYTRLENVPPPHPHSLVLWYTTPLTHCRLQSWQWCCGLHDVLFPITWCTLSRAMEIAIISRTLIWSWDWSFGPNSLKQQSLWFKMSTPAQDNGVCKEGGHFLNWFDRNTLNEPVFVGPPFQMMLDLMWNHDFVSQW